MKKSLNLILLLMILVISGCSEEIHVNAPYKDVTVVYGILNPDQSEGTTPDTTWIRIQKAYQINDNAVAYSEIPDSIYYADVLQHYILGYDENGNKVPSDSFYLERVVDPPGIVKQPGMFATQQTVLYKGVKTLDPTHSYELIIKKPTGEITRSKTEIPGKSTIIPPSGTIRWEQAMVNEANVPVVVFNWTYSAKTYAYQLGLQLNYEEWPTGNINAKVNRSASVYFKTIPFSTEYTCNFSHVCFGVTEKDFTNLLSMEIEPTATHQRRIKDVDIIVADAPRQLYEYIQSNKPSNSFAYQLYNYTNVENGVGIFASLREGRFNGVILHPEILSNPVMQSLNFVH